MDEPLLRLDLVGHPAVRATHGKTLEFSTDSAITERATCVVGVAARTHPAGTAFAGPVRITLTAGGEQAVVDAVANPDWRPGGSAVVRRSGERLPDTFATDATLAAAGLPRRFVAAAAVAGAPITVRVERLSRRPDGRAGLVLAWASPTGAASPRLRAEVDAADAVVADDTGAARLLGELGVAMAAPADAVAGLLGGTLGRVLVIATAELPGAGVTSALAHPGAVAVETTGLPPGLAAAAASPWRGPVHLAGLVPGGRLDAVLRAVPAEVGVAGSVLVADLPKLVEVADRHRAVDTGVLLDGTATWGRLADLRAIRTGGTVTWFLDGADRPSDLDPDLAGLVSALLAEGVSARSLATALAGRPGWSRRRAYDAVHALRPAQE